MGRPATCGENDHYAQSSDEGTTAFHGTEGVQEGQEQGEAHEVRKGSP
jgi:hypothetical protein